MASNTIHIRRGFDIKLQGRAAMDVLSIPLPKTFSLKPADFIGIERPKLHIREGDEVKAGTPLLFDKLLAEVQYCSPVSGEVARIERGPKRVITSVIILSDEDLKNTIRYVPFDTYTDSQVEEMAREKLVGILCKGGVWPQLIQRPYGIVAHPSQVPRAIFVSLFDTSPLAPDYSYVFEGDKAAFSMGILVLRRLSGKDVHLSLPAEKRMGYMEEFQGVRYHSFKGPHPSGNVGVQIHRISPIRDSSDNVWTISPYGVVEIGRLLLEGRYRTQHKVAITGSAIDKSGYIETFSGASISPILKDNERDKHHLFRYISGNVLTGDRVSATGHMGYYAHQLTVIPEGNTREFLGWILPSLRKLSIQRGLGIFSYLFPRKLYRLTANMNGEPRAFVQTSVLEKVLPMDIFITYLLKAILAEDYEEMESLGIYELVEEDVALCEFVDVSKHRVQSLLRQGIEMLRKG